MKSVPALATVVAVLLATGCGGASGGVRGPKKITVAAAPNAFLAALYVARDDGLFAKQGLAVDILAVENGNESIAALASGKAQFADIGFEDLAQLSAAGDDSVVMVHDILDRMTLTLVMRKEIAKRKGVNAKSALADRLRALRKLKIGITSPGAPSDTYMRYYLATAGLNPERDVELVPLGSGQALLTALEKGQIDAYQLSPPNPYVAAARGFGTVLIDGTKGEIGDFSRFDYTAWGGSRDWSARNRGTVAAFSRALTAATQKVKNSPDAVAGQILDDIGGDPATVREAVGGMTAALSDRGCFDQGTVQSTLDTLVKMKAVRGKPDPAEGRLWTNDYNGC